MALPFTFAKAGLRAPGPIRRLLARIRAMPVTERRKLPALYRILGSGTPPYKFAKADVRRSAHPVNGSSCGQVVHQDGSTTRCNRYYTHDATDTGLCDWVNGTWEKQEWCEYWTPAWTAARYRAYQQGRGR